MKILTATALLFAIALPATAQVGPAYSDRASGNLVHGQACTSEKGSSLSIRSGPGKNYRVITQVRDGNYIGLRGSQYGRDGFRWFRVDADGRQGWSRADYVCGARGDGE